MKVKTTPFLEYSRYYQHDYEQEAAHYLCVFELCGLAWPDWCRESPEVRDYFRVIARGGIPEECLQEHLSRANTSCYNLEQRLDTEGLWLIRATKLVVILNCSIYSRNFDSHFSCFLGIHRFLTLFHQFT